jgi:hypothetical protein
MSSWPNGKTTDHGDENDDETGELTNATTAIDAKMRRDQRVR